MFYTMYKSPVLLNVGFSGESGEGDAAGYDYKIDESFDISSFCKTVNSMNSRRATCMTWK